MTSERFEKLLDEQLELCKKVLGAKAAEYATEDRLHNFKVAGAFEETTPEDALFGMMAKHLVSVKDMCKSGRKYPVLLWQEKITDSINYLLLLNALVRDE